MTLEKLAEQYTYETSLSWQGSELFTFNKAQLRALITEAVEIVQGDSVGYKYQSKVIDYYDVEKHDRISGYTQEEDWEEAPLHHNDMTRLK